MAFKGKELRNSCIFVNAVFYETLQVLIFAYLGVLWYFWHDFFVKISERSTLAYIRGKYVEILSPENGRDGKIYNIQMPKTSMSLRR